MVQWSNTIENVLSRIYLEGIARNSTPPQLYYEAKQALGKLDKTCVTVNSNSDPNSPVGWRRNNYPILVVGKKNDRLKFTYPKKQLNNGEILIIVDEAAYAYGNILTENIWQNSKRSKKKVIKLTETQFKQMLVECITKMINEIA